MGTTSWLGLVALGVAIHWAVRISLSGSHAAGRGGLILAMRSAAWVLILFGALGPITAFWGGPPLALAAVAVFGMAVHRYRENERLSILWCLGASIERGLPANLVARALADERNDEIGGRVARLSELLEAGRPMADAFAESGNPLPTDASLAVRLGGDPRTVGRILMSSARRRAHLMPEVNAYLHQLFYVGLVGLLASLVLLFLMIRVVPVFEQIMIDFGVDGSGRLDGLIQMSWYVAMYWYLAVPFIMLIGVANLLLALNYLGWLRWEPPPLRFLTRKYHAAVILRTLGEQLRSGEPLSYAIDELAKHYPRRHVSEQLQKVSLRVARGEYWLDALKTNGLVGRAEAGVLSAAERVGNLVWALREMADHNMRRLRDRLSLVLRIAAPIFVLSLALLVGLTAVAVMDTVTQIVWRML